MEISNNAVIGVDLGATNVRAGKVKDGEIESLVSEKIEKGDTDKVLLEQIANLVEQINDDETLAIGIGVPSVVDIKKGIVYDVQNIPSWKKVPVKSFFEKRFNVPVFVNNDANCFALGEKYFGKGKDVRSMIGLIIGTGYAAGLVLDGRLYSGENCGAGEIGVIPYKDSIYEHYCSAQFFEREYNSKGEKIFQKAQKGEPDAIQMFKEYGKHLGNGIKVALYAYDPEMIVLGGSVRNAYSFFKESMWETVRDFEFPSSLASLKIEVSERDNIAILGAAAIAIESMTSSQI